MFGRKRISSERQQFLDTFRGGQNLPRYYPDGYLTILIEEELRNPGTVDLGADYWIKRLRAIGKENRPNVGGLVVICVSVIEELRKTDPSYGLEVAEK